MLVRILPCLGLLLLACPGLQTFAQGQEEFAPAPPASATFASYGDQQEDADQEALAKQMNEIHQRLKALEAGSQKLTEEQQDGSFTERLGKLEDGQGDNTDAIEEIDGSLGDYVKHGHGDQRMKIFGRIHEDYWAFPSEGTDIITLEGGVPQDRFVFRRMRLGASGNVNDNMLYKVELEFADGNNPSYRDAYLGWEHLPFFNTLLVGNQKRPYGYDHLNSSRYNVFIERPFAIEAFNQDSRRLGICSYGYSEDLCNNWRFGIFNQELTQNKNGYVGNNYQAELAGRFARTWWYDECSGGRGYGHIALSGSYGSPDGLDPVNNQSRYRTRPEARSTRRWIDTGRIAGANEFALAGVEGVLNVGPVQVVAEYQKVNVGRLDFFGQDLQFDGGYAQVSYFLTGEHIPWDRKSGTIGRIKPFENFFSVRDCDGFTQRGLGAWQVAARYSYADFTDQTVEGGTGNSVTFGLNWYWNPYARMQFNYIAGDIDSATTVAGAYQIVGVRFMIDF